MRATRLPLTIAATLVLALSMFAGIAEAGVGMPADGTTECADDPQTGGFVITITINNLLAEEGELYGEYDSTLVGVGEGPMGVLTFVPPTLPANGTSSASFVVPANTAIVGGQVVVTYAEDTAIYNIDGTGDIFAICGADTPTTTATTAPATTAPAGPAGVAPVVATPRFTG